MSEVSVNTEGDSLKDVAMNLLAAFQALGAEHQALAAEEQETTAAERRGTVRRMVQSITYAARTVAESVEQVATIYGLRAFGISQQRAKDADGANYSALLSIGDAEELLYETAAYVQAAAQRLGEAYQPTKKHPGLARARRPQEMRTVLTKLGAALTALSAEVVERNLTDDAGEFDRCIAFLVTLEERVCRVVPAQASGPSAEDVTAAILADPEIARAAAAALERAGA
ncbi:hypothetical protein N4G70_36120 [Streptomyces sp. ASQP_92]|uniref:hypothetical protein n=1 Tax=Streptomyces sp. ASQP_92 TaxID=2979116 RepID=UPI0021BE9C50|nr:hypothetical protein [Streptomyces sp. ASQP_92]MCT9094229.1 hypothetical protein [Streptomyces sp. ASQP_92]